ncbi:MAG: DUF58 domain-containing protein [Elusimicrobia bacterium]|nr:DUF58 domain-containing protein [Elusimicrobiota bacterium]
MKYLDPIALAKLRNLDLRVRKSVSWAPSSGRHRSATRGLSNDFAQHRAYAPGDELRRLDWKVYARKDRFYVKEFDEERMATATIMVDASGSMGFGGKWDLACRLAMAMAYLVVAKGDAAGILTFDVGPREAVPPRAGLGHLEALDAALGRSAPGGETDLGRVLEKAAGQIKRRSLIVLVSDLMGDPSAVVAVLKSFKARRHEVMVLRVLDPRERSLDFEGPVVFESLEDGGTLASDADAIREPYVREFERIMRLYESGFHGAEMAYASFFTDVRWELSLANFLSRGSK